MKAVSIGGINFSSKAEAEEFLRAKMWTYELGKPIPDEDVALWFDVLQRHEWFDEFVDHGISSFAAARSLERPHLRNMVVVNAAGEQKPFSYHKYLTKSALSKLERVTRALRTEIASQIEEFKAAEFGRDRSVQCAITGEQLDRKSSHVHHAGDRPFLRLVDEFLEKNRDRWATIETEAAGIIGYRLSDRALAADWATFHRRRAKLEIVSVSANLKAGVGGYRTKFDPPSAPLRSNIRTGRSALSAKSSRTGSSTGSSG